MRDDGMIDTTCKCCGEPARMKSTSKSIVCSKCVLSGRVIPDSKLLAESRLKTVDEESQSEEESTAETKEMEKSVSQENPDVKENVEPPLEDVAEKQSASINKEATSTKKEKKNPSYGMKTERVNCLLKTEKKTKEIVAELQKEFPSDDPVALRNLVYVQRNRMKKAK